MKPYWQSLNKQDLETFRTTVVFLKNRLEEQETIDWALQLKSEVDVKRLALLELINHPNEQQLREPWCSAWRLIEEYWNNPVAEDHASIAVYDFADKLNSGALSGTLISNIVDQVAPKLKISPIRDWMDLKPLKSKKRPKTPSDLFSATLTSGKVINTSILKLEDVSDRSFLTSLAYALEAAIQQGLDIAVRIGWDEKSHFWRLGSLYRVYNFSTAENTDDTDDPDMYHEGIAPSVKLLYATITQIINIDLATGIQFLNRLKLNNRSPIHLRLWAALSRISQVTPASEVGKLLLSISDRCFWDLYNFPEIAELRAKRFAELDQETQTKVITRIRKLPPRDHWPKTAADHVKEARLYQAARELKRIEISGATLPEKIKAWLDLKITQFEELGQMTQIDHGFKEGVKVTTHHPAPDSRFDSLTGIDRLKAIQISLSSVRKNWNDDPAERAADWIRTGNNSIKILSDFETTSDGGAAFPNIWEKFGWTHSTRLEHGQNLEERNLTSEAARVLALIIQLPIKTIKQSIEGISHWLSSWEEQTAGLPEGRPTWFHVWPAAVTATNERQPRDTDLDLNIVVHSPNEEKPMDLDTLNTPAGKLVGVFLSACPSLQGNINPFTENEELRTMRDAVITATAYSGLIAKHRLIESLPYFLRADPDWTKEYLITPLIEDSTDALALWQAIARQTHFQNVLGIIGNPMTDRAVDNRLDRKTRISLVFSLIVECLHAYHESRDPAVPYARIQQMIRLLDDEVRASGARAIQRFLQDVSKGDKAPSPETLFQSVVKPFMENVWPQEHSLVTPGLSKTLATIPASSRGAFAEAVQLIERFLIPFDCWAIHDYGIYEDTDGEQTLSIINTQEKASAFLKLLDLTIGKSENSVIPHGLSDALTQVNNVAPDLINTQVFRRLQTLARR